MQRYGYPFYSDEIPWYPDDFLLCRRVIFLTSFYLCELCLKKSVQCEVIFFCFSDNFLVVTKEIDIHFMLLVPTILLTIQVYHLKHPLIWWQCRCSLLLDNLAGWPLVLECLKFLELFLNFFGSGIVLEKHHILAVVLEMFLKSHFCLRCSQGL